MKYYIDKHYIYKFNNEPKRKHGYIKGKWFCRWYGYNLLTKDGWYKFADGFGHDIIPQAREISEDEVFVIIL